MIFANAGSQKEGGREGGGKCEYLIIYVGPGPTEEMRVLRGWRFEPLFTYSSMFYK